MLKITEFIKKNIPLCVGTFGLAIFGYLGYRAVCWIIKKCQKTEKIDQVAQKNIGVPFNNPSHITTYNPAILDMPANNKTALRQEVDSPKIMSAIKIQNAYRGPKAHLALNKLQAENQGKKESNAATKIQSVWRGYSARVKVEKIKKPLLSYALLEKAKPHCAVPSNFQDRKTYIPKDLPLVLRQVGSPQNENQFNQMKQGHDLCDKNGYEHLIIPKARAYGILLSKADYLLS